MRSDINTKPVNRKKNKEARRHRAGWNKGHHNGKSYTGRDLANKVDPPQVQKEKRDEDRKDAKIEKEKRGIE